MRQLVFPVFLFEDVEVFFAPLKHLVDYREQGFAEFSNLIFRTGRKLRIDGLFHKSILNHFLQLNVKDTRCRLGQTFMNLAGPHRFSRTEFVEYARFPFGFYEAHCQPQRTIEVYGYLLFVCHKIFLMQS